MLAVGLTGNIACGKSFVASVFAELGALVLDADLVAHDLLGPGEATRDRLVEAFGAVITNDDSSIDRRKLGQIVFSDPAKRDLLNSIVHPEVRLRISAWLEDARRREPGGVAVVQAALMLESGSYRLYDRIVVVTCPPAVQLERLMGRDGMSEVQALARIRSQMPQEEKVRYAHHVIDTADGFESARKRTSDVFRELLTESQASPGKPA